MIKSIEALRQKRLKWVEANRENDFEEGIKRLLTDLYPDNAHFIYELLQNAEDTHASTIRFKLTGNAVEFEHDGDRLFNLKDVESITSIGTSTKRDEPTSIGKFGVGFKAVFAYTRTPEIHSGEFHFRIHDLVVPDTNGVKKPNMGDRETCFAFPFDHPMKRPAQATEEVERALRALGDNTLLFLTHIRTIEYQLPDGSSGSLKRVDYEGERIEIRACHPGGKNTVVSHWLRFQDNLEIKEGSETKHCQIAIAYSLVEEKDIRESYSGWKIVPLKHGQVSIFFPADKETSNLRFHIHAPFASTVARDSVRDCDANRQLRDCIADLVVESLAKIRDRDMLSISFLAILPNEEDNLPEFYEPIRKKIVDAFKNKPLTPTKSRTHAPATKLYRGPAKISEVLNDDDLSLLTNENSRLWTANPPQQNQREDRFLENLDIGRWEWSDLSRALKNSHWDVNGGRKRFEGWFSQKDDAWVMRFYALLGEAHSEHNESLVAQALRIVRVEASQGSEHVIPSDAFFPPPDQETDTYQNVSFVKPTVYSKGGSERKKKFARLFLEQIGVRLFDAKTVIELKLGQYDDNPPDRVGAGHYKDMKQFITYWKKYPDNKELFSSHAFLRSQSEDGALDWEEPEQLCLDDPYEETGLAELSKIHGKNEIWNGYKEKLPGSMMDDFVAFMKAIGVMHNLEVKETSTRNNPNRKELRQDYTHPKTKWIHNVVIDEDYWIPNIDKYLEAKSISASRLIWNAMIYAAPKSAKASFTLNSKCPTRTSKSQLACLLNTYAWIPDKSGSFQKPQDMIQDNLRSDFPYDDRNGLLTVIGFGERAKRRSEEYQARNEFAKVMGFSSAEEAEELAKLVSETGVTSGELRSLVSQRQLVSQPEESVTNPERRRKGVLERRENAPAKESVSRERTILPGARPETLEAKAYLRIKYRNREGQLVCQCCHDEMPFKIRNEYYFEAVQCVSDLDVHRFENRLALCPTCAAMYQHARETDNKEIRRLIIENSAPDTAKSVEIKIRLAGREMELHFVGPHWFDLKTALEKLC